MTETRELLVNESGAVCTLTINTPQKRNVVTPSMLLEIEEAFGRLAREDKIRCVVIRGSGGSAFSSGYDIAAIREDDMIRNFEGDNPLPRAIHAIETFPYLVIAMINGHAFGAGLEIAATCDIRISVDGCMFGMPPAKLGVVYSYRGVRRFLNLIGPGYTKELFLTGRPINPERAAAMGLVNFVVKPEELEEFTYTLAREIADNAPLSMKAMKEMTNVWQRSLVMSPEDEALLKELTLGVQESADYKEGQKAFAEKRKPVFNGK